MVATTNIVEAQTRKPRTVDSLTTASSSRSTSPGAFLTQASSLDAGALAFVVRNTFIDTDLDARTALFAQQPSSCPAGKIGSMTLPESPAGDSAATALRTCPSTVEEPAFGSAECPTVGSAAHSLGTCKPCAFLYTKGCASGVECTFCHLCEPGEKKRRAKELKQLRRAEVERQALDLGDVDAPLDADSSSDRCNNTLSTATPPLSPPSARPPPLGRRCPSYISTSTSSEEYAYVIRNTFIDEAPLEDVFDDRRAIFSCPASRIGGVLIPEAEEYADFAASQIEAPVCWPSTPPLGEQEACRTAIAAPHQSHGYPMLSAAFYEEAFLAFGSNLLPYVDDVSAAPPADRPPVPLAPSGASALDAALAPASLALEPSLADAAPSSASRVLHLSEALPAPELGSAECPTRGSAGHHVGLCKPCAFFHKQGCSNGVQCEFCHLCDSGEKKRRQKEKKAQIRVMHAMENLS